MLKPSKTNEKSTFSRAWGWAWGALGRFYYPGTIRELSGNYPGFGWLGWGGRAGRARWERILGFSKEMNP